MSDDRPLAGVRVLDLSHFVAGPWCTMLLADLGATVTKVEPPGTGEIGRRMGAVYAGSQSAIFLGFNRGKRGVALDLKAPGAREVLHALVERSDVVVHNLRPGTPERLGVDAPTLRAVRPELIHCAISAFGTDGPYAAQPANDPIIQAVAGAMLDAGDGVPRRMGVPVPDFAAGVLAATGILGALRRRALSGEGCTVELSLLGAQMYARADRLRGAADPGPPWAGAHRCRDGRFLELTGRDDWATVCRALGHRDWATRPPADRGGLCAQALATRPCADWAAGLTAAGIGCAPVNELTEAFAAAAADLTTSARHTELGPLAMVATPIRATPPWRSDDGAPPLLGEHTAEVLTEAGVDADELAALARDGIVALAER